MDRSDRKNKKERKRPRIPIKTYRWEDVRRARKKGGYPWTHLYKHPFYEELDVEPYTMEGMRKAKSSSTVGRSDGEKSDWGKSDLEISEFSDVESSMKSGEVPEKMDTLQIVSESDNHSSKNSGSSINIEEIEASDKDEMNPENILDPAESWDNVSQYLDKEENLPASSKTQESEEVAIPETSKENDINRKIDEENEETTKRKRKLSAESSYSRISQTKLAIMKKLSETKKKIKVPKISFSVSKLKKPKSIPKKQKNSPPETKKEMKKSSQSPKNSKPVYIHIPLKPPSGQSDEFSYLEFGEKKESKETPKKPGSFRDLVRNMKQIQEQNQTTDQNSKSNKKPEIGETINEETGESITPSEENKENVLDEEQEIHSKKSDEAKSLFKKCDNYHMSIDEDSSPKDQKDESVDIAADSKEDKKDEDIFEHLFQASSSKKPQEVTKTSTKKNVRSKSAEPEGRKRKLSMESSYSRKSLSKLSFLKKLKDASDKLKNTLSRSDSKKKTKAKEEEVKKIKTAETKKEEKKTKQEKAKEEEVKTNKTAETKKEEKKTKHDKSSKPVQPVYIHIPLKPPEGQTDEFSYLEHKEKPAESAKTPETPETPETPDTPDTPTTPPPGSVRRESAGVQFIILTAPSDDEVLDYNSSDVCETPSSENKLFFGNKITELKQIAKDVVDELQGSKKLESVEEEANGEEDKKSLNSEKNESVSKADESNKISEKTEDPKKTVSEDTDKPGEDLGLKTEETKTSSDTEVQKMMVDEEDGLNETKPVKQEECKEENTKEETTDVQEDKTEVPEAADLKSSLKTGSPVVKKKVSFKRRSKTPKDGSYEDIQAPEQLDKDKKDETDADKNEQAISVIGKVIGDASLEDDKWSKISDHEYEPVNPPPDNVETFPPQVYVIDTDYDSSILPLGSVSLESTAPTPKNVPKTVTETKIETVTVKKQSDNSNSASTSVSSTKKQTSASSDKSKEGPSKFQLAFRQKKENLKNKLHNMKKPHLTMPERPKFTKPDFKKFKIEKPKINLPKIPDTTKINLPHFSLQRKPSGKRSLKERQLSTESNDGDSKKKPIFDFSTYPRIFKKKPSKAKPDDAGASDFATVPRTKKSGKPQTESSSKWSGSDSVRIPLHSEDSMENGREPPNGSYIHYQEEEDRDVTDRYEEDRDVTDRYEEDERMTDDSPMRPEESSRIRYEEDIDIDDDENEELNRERDFLTRWDHGRFNEDFNEEYLQNLKNSNYKVTDLDSPEDNAEVGYDYNSNEQGKDRYSSGSSFGQRRGVMEEINSDEFFWRPKGISQDDIHISMNISSEIREAFRTPANALTQIENVDDYKYNDHAGSQQSLPEAPPKRKPIKKPKRKKTPHTSQERIAREESADDDLDVSPPSRPKRRSKRKKKDKNTDDFIPYRETISVDEIPAGEDRMIDHRESLGVLGDDERDEEIMAYENERMEGKEQPEIRVTDPYSHFEFADEEQEVMVERPAAPPRKQKSLKSLNLSENDSILGEFSSTRAISGDTSFMKEILEPEIEAIRTESKVIIPIDQELPPQPPKRPSRIRSDSRSRGTSQADEGSVSRGTSQIDEQSVSRIDFDVDDVQIPCVEESCIKDIRDPMGYAVIDKTKVRDPPLPPPRTLTRQKRSHKSDKGKFNTVPRSSDDVPVRPLRNYSTLGQTRKALDQEEFENDKENIDITQYIEIDDEPKHLHSGEVIQKMKDRPLPAPPRPPRKGRALKDITSQENIMAEFLDDDELEDKVKLEEIEVSTQTEPLPDDFVCEEVVQEPSDRVLLPTTSSYEKTEDSFKEQTAKKQKTVEDVSPRVEKRLAPSTFYPYEETITHGSLLVEPLNGAKILPESEIISVSREVIIPVTRESEDETSSIPEEFHKWTDPTSKHSLPRHSPFGAMSELEVLKAQKLQVADLDVDQLRVNQLTASKIVVSEIDSGSIHTDEIGSKGGALTVGEINLPPSVIDQIIKSIRSSSETLKDEKSESVSGVQKKTSTNEQPREIVQIETLIEEIMEVEERPCTIVREVTEPPKTSSSLENIESQILVEDNEPFPSSLNIEPEDPPAIDTDHPLSQENIINENEESSLSQTTNILEHEDRTDRMECVSPIENVSDLADTSDVNMESLSPKIEEDYTDSSPPIPPPRSTSESVVIHHQILDETGQPIPQRYLFDDQPQAEPQTSSETPPRPPPRGTDSENLEIPPTRPPREKHRRGSASTLGESIQEPEVDDEPPPRPPEPQLEYLQSQPPASFYALRAQKYVDENIPAAPRRRRHRRSRPRSKSISSTEDDSSVSRRPQRRSSEPSIAQLSSQLVRAASTEVNNSFKRLIEYIMNNVLGNADGKQDLNVMILIVLVLIAGLILLGHEDERTVVHLHHWEYFNPPRDL